METQEELGTKIGNIEPENKKLEPKKVQIVKVEVIEVGEKKSKKVNCFCKHPDYSEGNITLSSVSYLKDKKIVTTGLWFNLDSEKKIQKGSALHTFLIYMNCESLKELEGKEVETTLEGNYLVFKAY